MKKISNKGFTLIELLATILIIGLVLGVTTYGIIISVNKAKEKSTNLSLTSIKEAARIYSGELGEDSWKNISGDDKNTYFCVTIEELINKGLLNKNANSVENGGKTVDYVVVVKNKTTKVIEKEEILTESNSEDVSYQICTGNIKNEVITRKTKIDNTTSYTDSVEINFTDADFETKITKRYCEYGESSSNLNKKGTIDETNKICTLGTSEEGLTKNKTYYTRVCVASERGSESCSDTVDITTKDIVAPTIAVDTNKNNSVKITYDNSNIKGEAFYYFKSTIDGTSSINVSTCSLNNNDKYTCNNDSVNNITKDTWYRVSNKEISITYSTPGNITVTAETRDKSNNSTQITKEFSLYKTTFNKGNADTIGGQTSNIELICLANKGNSCSITSPSIEKSGYQVIGWNTNSNATTSSWDVNTTKSIKTTSTYYSIFKLNTYTVNYSCGTGSGTAPTAQTATYGQNFTVASNTCTKTGYTFLGWTTNSDGSDDGYGWTGWSGTWKYVNGQYGISNGKLNLYAIWRKNVVTIKFSVNGGTLKSGSPYSVDSNGIVTKNSEDLHKMYYNDTIISTGLPNYDNPSYLNITKTGYIAVSGSEWICLSGNCVKSEYNQDDNEYKASDFCDASSSDCTITLGVNWEQVINNYRCSTSDNNNYYYITTCNETTCKYTRNNCNRNTSGTISRSAITQCKETTINGERCDISLKKMYSITTCTAADCKYSSGTIDRCDLTSCPTATFNPNGGTFITGISSYSIPVVISENGEPKYYFDNIGIPEVNRNNYKHDGWHVGSPNGQVYRSYFYFETGDNNITYYANWKNIGGTSSGTVSQCGECKETEDCYKPSSSTTVCDVQCVNSMCIWFGFKYGSTTPCSTTGKLCN